MKHLQFAQTPPMGWNSWDCFGASVTEQEVKENAAVMAEKLQAVGWEYVVVDIQWSEPTANSTRYHEFFPLCMDEYSRLIPAENRFPSAVDGQGFKPLADYVHGLGLKFGIHIMRGIPRQAVHQNTAIMGTDLRARDIALNNICPWNSDMYGVNVDLPEGQLYYDSLLELYASWGVDFIKVDDIAYSRLYNCAHQKEIAAIQRAIQKTGRPIVLSLSPGPAQIEEGVFLQNHANMWRLTDDLWDSWPALYAMFERASKWAPYIQPGTWPDCDMLPLGHIGIRAVDGGGGDNWTRLTEDEQYTMMTLWTIFQSPLMFGGTLTDMDPFTERLLTNQAVMQMYHTLNTQREAYRDDQWVIWQAASADASYMAVFNVSDEENQLPVELFGDVKGHELWENRAVNLATERIPAHGTRLIKL